MDARERARRRLDAWVLAQRRKDHRLTQQVLAARAGKSQGWLSKAITRGPSFEDLDVIAALMETTAAGLVGTEPAFGISQEVPMPDNIRYRIRHFIEGLPPDVMTPAFERDISACIRRHLPDGSEPSAREADTTAS